MDPITILEKSVSGLSLPVLGLGCYFFGHSADDELRDIGIIRLAYQLGVRHFDVAKRYGKPKEQGRSEMIVGKALEIFPRNSYVLVTKILPQELGHDRIGRAVRESLNRLQSDFVDVIMPHNPPTSDVSVREMVDNLTRIKELGLATTIGLSQFTLGDHLEDVIRFAPAGLISAAQFRHNLAFRDFEHDQTIECCRRNDMLVVAYRPFYQGVLLEQPHPNLQQVANKHSRPPAQICLKWLIQQPGIVTIFGTTNPVHLEENLGTLEGDWQLDAEDNAWLRQIPRIAPS